MKILVFFSGGKDSQACLIWAAEKFGVNRIEAVFCDTGWEHPDTLNHIKTVTDSMGIKLVTLKSAKYDGFVDLALKKGRFPSTKARFCTEELKSKPAIDYVLSHTEHLIVIEGIRRNESLSRSKMEPECMYFRHYFEPMANGKKHTYRKKYVLDWCKKFNADKLRPIFHWSAKQVMDYILSHDQKPNPLYYQGFSRVGCFPCIMARHNEVRLLAEFHPEMKDRIIDAEKMVGINFFPPEYISKKVNGSKVVSAERIMQHLEKSDMDMFDEGGYVGCMSMYGLCE